MSRAASTDPLPLLVSSRSEAGLREQACSLARWIDSQPELEPLEAAATVATLPGGGEHRAAVLGGSREELLAGLSALAAGQPATNLILGRAPGQGGPVFVFPGQGSQWVGMGLELLESSEAFRVRMSECETALAPYLDVPLSDILRSGPDDPRWKRADAVQPLLFAVKVSLAEVWRAAGVVPAAVVGHSIGEAAAACVAGALSLADGARLAALWARALQGVPGAMASMSMPAAELERRLAAWNGRLEIAGINGPHWCAATGDEDALDALLAQLADDGIRAWRIDVSLAGHSRHVDAVREQMLSDLGPLEPRSAEMPFYSATSGDLFDTAGLGATHWATCIRQPVLFERAIRAALRDGHRTFIEVSPRPVLTMAVQETGEAAAASALSSLRRDQGGQARLTTALAEAHVQGVEVDWAGFFAVRGARMVEPPPSAGFDAAAAAGEPDEAVAAPSLRTRLQGLPEAEQESLALALVRVQVATLLGLTDPQELDQTLPFNELGLDSAVATELRSRLNRASGLSLPAAVAYDFPTAEKLAGHLRSLALGLDRGAAPWAPAKRSDDEPIAIVGIGCRYPGGVASAAQLWELVASGRDAISGFPEDRGWDPDPYDPESSGNRPREGGFLGEAAEFDAAFFGIGPHEALAMDPQQRLLLECAWEALEDAGLDPGSLAGASAGVFAGVSCQDYGPGLRPQRQEVGAGDAARHRLTGTLTSLLSGRIAYTLGLEGPALTVDTACSSSLVALHLAAGALRGGECELALAGGVTVMATPGMFIEFSRQRGLAPDGRCKSFSAAADGTGWSEGAGLLLLERLSDAEANGHQPIALIRGSATNQDGASNGLTAPNGPSQERVIRQALANAGLSGAEVDAVEAHGTGTTLGDPIEAQALLATYGQDRDGAEPLQLGSLKSNIGHSQAAAGVGGVIKMALALRHQQLPKTLHLDQPTPHVDWETGAVELLGEPREWKRGERTRRAGISSFGISGTNAHLILEEAPAPGPSEEEEPSAPLAAVPFLLSAKTPEALAAQAGRLGSHLSANPELQDADVALTLASARANLEHRAAVVGSTRSELLAGLGALAQGRPHPTLVGGRATSAKLAFLFPGQGSQWLGMGRELLDESAVFAARIGECEEALEPFVEWSLEETLRSEEDSWLQRVDVVQPALFATMVSLASLWRSHGVEPDAVLGHSQGEIAAAVLAGALSLEDGARVSALRSRALTELAGKGGMVSLSLSAEQASEQIAPWGQSLGLAALNGPLSTVVSGEPQALKELLASCEAEGIRARQIPVDYASHSPQVEAIEARLAEDLAPISPQAGELAFHSALLGERLDGTELGPEYWYRSLREPVRFEQATRGLLEDGFSAFVEVSSHPVLTMALGESVEASAPDPAAVAVLHTLRREGGGERFTAALAAAHAHGVAVEWAPLFEGSGARRASLPTYAFQRQRFWLEAAATTGDASALGQAASDHPLLGARVSLAGEGAELFTGRISRETHPWLGDHAVAGTAILPGTAFAELALCAGAQLGAPQLQELVLEAPLPIPAQGALQLRVSLTASEEEEGAYALEIHSRPEPEEGSDPAPFARHATGALGPVEPLSPSFDASAWPPPGAEPLDSADLYERLAAIGLDYGPAFQGLEAAWRLGEETYAEVSLAPEQEPEAGRFGLHPALLDAALHAAFLDVDAEPSQGVRLPFSFAGLALGEAGGATSLRVRVRAAGEQIAIETADRDGNPVASIAALALRELDPAQLQSAGSEPEALFALEWAELELGEAEDQPAELLRFAPDDSAGQDPAQAAQEQSARALAAIQAFLAEESRADEERLAILTEGAMACTGAESPDPALAAVWGLVRSAQSEHPGRFVLIDTDGSEASEQILTAALAQAAEPQLALREGVGLVPRLAAGEARELAVPAQGSWCLEPGERGDAGEPLPGAQPRGHPVPGGR